jgi:uncharacterized delta-60 repeat protein
MIRSSFIRSALTAVSVACSAVAFAGTPGSLDLAFNAGAVDGTAFAVEALPGGRTLVSGSFQSIGGAQRRSLAILNSDGSATSFEVNGLNGLVRSVRRLSDGRIAIGGQFSNLGADGRSRLAIVRSDGSVDPTFVASGGTISNVISIAEQADGSLVAAGQMLWPTGLGGLGRFLPSGELDPQYPALLAGIFEGDGRVVLRLSDGRMAVGGDFGSISFRDSDFFAIVGEDGSVERTFRPGASGSVLALAEQADGKLLVGGAFSAFGGQARPRLIRLNGDGTVDTTFTPVIGDGAVLALAVDASNRILIGGSFTSVGGVSRRGIARLLPNGALDLQFDPGAGVARTNGSVGIVNSISVQSDGKVLFGGSFDTFNGQLVSNLGRLHAEGAVQLAGYEPWAAQHFTEAEAELAGRMADPDGDGLPNLMEFAIGTNPRIPSKSIPVVSRVNVGENSYLQIAFPRAAAAETFVRYEVEADSMLGNGPWQVVWSSDNALYTGPGAVVTQTVVDTQPIGSGDRRFLRLRVTEP